MYLNGYTSDLFGIAINDSANFGKKNNMFNAEPTLANYQ